MPNKSGNYNEPPPNYSKPSGGKHQISTDCENVFAIINKHTYVFFKVMIPAIVVVVAAAAVAAAVEDRGTIEEAVLMGML